ncbi:MAG TPA: N-acetyltransferase [Candidatus Onthovicinus excrementipullorum]|nr:N-acetyltransferase [Candidatus Onthovicinus excrementipullorum]
MNDSISIRPFLPDDLNAILKIWLSANLQAHDFIDAAYWADHLEMVRDLLPQAEIYVYQQRGTPCGFIGITDGDYIAGIFVDESCRSQGIGKKLLDHVKQKHPLLKLHVYQKNGRAVRFYLREGFTCAEEHVDSATGESELLLTWENKS